MIFFGVNRRILWLSLLWKFEPRPAFAQLSQIWSIGFIIRSTCTLKVEDIGKNHSRTLEPFSRRVPFFPSHRAVTTKMQDHIFVYPIVLVNKTGRSKLSIDSEYPFSWCILPNILGQWNQFKWKWPKKAAENLYLGPITKYLWSQQLEIKPFFDGWTAKHLKTWLQWPRWDPIFLQSENEHSFRSPYIKKVWTSHALMILECSRQTETKGWPWSTSITSFYAKPVLKLSQAVRSFTEERQTDYFGIFTTRYQTNKILQEYKMSWLWATRRESCGKYWLPHLFS